ncbi:uncharacterized protein [Drosophila kikkawai]|uniref:Uncharacterized protein n=1 Tax=Drosophila kikkawai TaxID=30033 RepID=A0A6P4IRT1_DROKI|nr:uncharacterized protein LOC108076992 [Drosophila kikkawai]
MQLLAFLFAVLAVVAMVSANNPMCNDAAQSGGGYQVYEMSAQGRNAPRNYNYGSTKNYNRNSH